MFSFFFKFDNDYEEFKINIEGLKQQLQMFVDFWFDKPLSVSVLGMFLITYNVST